MILYINPRQKDENFRDDRRNELPEKKYKKKNDDKAVAFEENTDWVLETSLENRKKNLGAVEWWDRNKVEDSQKEVDEYDIFCDLEDFDTLNDVGRNTDSDQKTKNDSDRNIWKWTSSGNYRLTPTLVAEVVWVVRYRFCPTYEKTSFGNKKQEWQKDRAEWVKMFDWIQSEPALVFGGWIPQHVCRITVRDFVNHDRKY